MPEPLPYIVGRQSEVERFATLVSGDSSHWLLNIYGPGGIGKTIVGQKMREYARENNLPLAMVDGIRPDLTPDQILYAIKEGIATTQTLAEHFADFESQHQEYLIVQDVLQRTGGINALFDVVGNIKNVPGFTQIIGSIGKTITEQTHRKLSNRFALERYLRSVERVLTGTLATSLATIIDRTSHRPAIIIDTYEEMEGFDDWVCRTLVPTLPQGIKIVVLGRNALPKINFDWGEFGSALLATELPELLETDAKAYLVHHGLRDAVELDEVYRFTGGYPLLLVLIVHLAREAGGWDKIGKLESAADQDHVATELLKRILREERAKEVQAFLEKGVVARWFTPEVISTILEVSAEDGRIIYDKLKRHSFVERHPYGLKFHDKIRELLLARLKFNAPEYDRVVKRLTDYYAAKAGIKKEETGTSQETQTAKYNIYVQDSSGITIGDSAQVQQHITQATDLPTESDPNEA